MIRIPQSADTETQTAFRDIEKWLQSIESAQKDIAGLDERLESLQSQVDSPTVAPSLTRLGDTSIVGDLRVDGSINVRGSVDTPNALDGLVVATPSGTGGSSTTQRVVEVHGSLAVLNALSAETLRARNLQVYGTITAPYGIVYRLHTDATDVGNVGTGEDDLMTYLLPANTLSADLQTIRVTAWGRWGATGNVKLLRAYFGATSILLTVAGHAPNAGGWRAAFDIVRTGAATQILVGHNTTRDAAGSSFNFVPDESAPTETLSGAVTIKMTGEATATNDIVQKGMIVELLS